MLQRRRLCQLITFTILGIVVTIIILNITNPTLDILYADAATVARRPVDTDYRINEHRIRTPDAEYGQHNSLLVEQENLLPSRPHLSSPIRADVMTDRRAFVKGMMKFAWDNYEKYAWSYNELHPMSRQGSGGAGIGDARLGATIIDSLDTLKIMGLDSELKRATEWVRDQFHIQKAVSLMSVFEANIRLLGGLLSAHALTTERMFMEKAIQVAEVLLAAFNNSRSGFPYSNIELPSLQGSLFSWFAGECVSLADVGTLHMEFAYLSEITGDARYLNKVTKVRQLIKNSKSAGKLYPNELSFRDVEGAKCHDRVPTTVGSLADSFYEYLFKNWLLSDKADTEAKIMFDEALDTLESKLLQTSKAGFGYFAKLDGNGELMHNVEHLACFIGGLYALSAEHSSTVENRMNVAKDITKTCHASYNLTRTRIGPEAFVFDDEGYPAPASDAKQYSLRPETAESYYYLWKKTGSEVYREWAWQAVKAIERHCRKPFGYTGISDVDSLRPAPEDIQQSFFLAETLKYFYLIFLDDDPLPLDTWVYNTEAHPLPVIGSQPYRQAFYSWRRTAFSSEYRMQRA